MSRTLETMRLILRPWKPSDYVPFAALNADPRCSESDLRAIMENTGRAVAHRLERYLSALGTIASAAPLLGLLGTVIGMIEIFGSQSPAGGATGGNPAQLALLSGEVDYTLDNLATVSTNLKSGKVVALAVTTAQRSPLLPDVPAIAESYPGFEIDTWWGLVAPAGTPKEMIDKLNAAFTDALRSPEIKAQFAQLMAEPAPTTPEQFAALIRRELARYENVVGALGLKAG